MNARQVRAELEAVREFLPAWDAYSVSFIYCRHFPVATMRQSNIERKMYAELRDIRASIKALQARIDYVLTDLREYRKRESRAREDETQSYPEWLN